MLQIEKKFKDIAKKYGFRSFGLDAVAVGVSKEGGEYDWRAKGLGKLIYSIGYLKKREKFLGKIPQILYNSLENTILHEAGHVIMRAEGIKDDKGSLRHEGRATITAFDIFEISNKKRLQLLAADLAYYSLLLTKHKIYNNPRSYFKSKGGAIFILNTIYGSMLNEESKRKVISIAKNIATKLKE